MNRSKRLVRKANEQLVEPHPISCQRNIFFYDKSFVSWDVNKWELVCFKLFLVAFPLYQKGKEHSTV